MCCMPDRFAGKFSLQIRWRCPLHPRGQAFYAQVVAVDVEAAAV
jgi:hypothetical protein